MTRKAAFSMALALTTLVTFALVAISVRAGFFGLGGDSRGAQPSTAQVAALGNTQAQAYELSLAPSTASPTPRVTTEYVYYDDGTYGPAPDPAADTSNNDGGSPSGANGGSQDLNGEKQTASPQSNRTAPQFIAREDPSTPTPVLTGSPDPEQHEPEVTPTPTPTPKVPDQEPADDPQPSRTVAPRETEEPQATQEPRNTEEPRETAKPQGTPEPHETQRPQETQEPHDD